MHNSDFIDELPGYDDVIRERRILEENRKMKVTCHIADFLAAILAIALVFFFLFTDTIPVYHIDVKVYCKDPRFKSPIPEIKHIWMWIYIAITLITFVALQMIKNKLGKRQLTKGIIYNIGIIVTQAIFLFVFVHLVKCISGIPRPYFFSDSNLRNHYCNYDEVKGNLSKGNLSKEYEKIDDDYRKTFPSYRATMYLYCFTFLYFYMGHYAIKTRFHLIQHFILVLVGSSTSYILYHSWLNGEHHFMDILVGASLGFIQGIITIRSIYGSILSVLQVTNNNRNKVARIIPSAPPLIDPRDNIRTVIQSIDSIELNLLNNRPSYETISAINIANRERSYAVDIEAHENQTE